jgi:hypothetical protein
MRVLHKRTKIKTQGESIAQKYKYSKHRMRVILEPNVQKLILD